MNRRHLLRLLSAGLIGHTLEVDKLLWVPGAKTIFLPPMPVGVRGLNISDIIAYEMERVAPMLKHLFERDEMFYRTLPDAEIIKMAEREMRIPLEIRPQGAWKP